MRSYRYISAILLLTQAAGCHRLRTVQTPAAFVNSQLPARIWVTPANGPELPLDAPRVVSDTLYGFSLMSGQVVTFALSDLERVRARELWVGPTIALGLVSALVLVAVALYLGGRVYTEPLEDPDDSVVPVW